MICDHCGEEIEAAKGPGGRPRSSKYGGKFWCRNKRECKNARSRYITSITPAEGWRGECEVCGGAIPTGTRFCTKNLECDRARNRDRQKRFVEKKKAEGIDVYAPYRAGIYARRKARIASGELAPARQRYAERTRQADQRRKALRLGATIEEFTHLEIFERDRWLCGICLMPVDPEIRWPDPCFASLDHIIPLTKGGAHSRANTQLAHLDCNVRKGNRLIR